MSIQYDNFMVKILGNLSEEMTNKYQDKKYKHIHLGQGKWTLSDSKNQCELLRTPHESEPYKEKITEVYGEDSWPITSVEDVDKLIRLQDGEQFMTYLRILYLPMDSMKF
mgnify:CR=1 FL=1